MLLDQMIWESERIGHLHRYEPCYDRVVVGVASLRVCDRGIDNDAHPGDSGYCQTTIGRIVGWVAEQEHADRYRPVAEFFFVGWGDRQAVIISTDAGRDKR